MTAGGRQQAQTIVVPGVQLASGTSVKYPIFNEDGGTLRLQIPEFKQRGLDVEAYFGGDYFCGTLNLSCAPRIVRIGQPHAPHSPREEWGGARNFYC